MKFTFEQNRIYHCDGQGKLLAEVLFPGENEDTAAITHVFVDESLRGQGIAGKLMEAFVSELQARGKKAKAVCPYAVKWFEKHPEYSFLLRL
jgi:predicted GNAT family acetyltransferase